MSIQTNLKSYSVLIECKGKPVAEYLFENILAENEQQIRKWARLQPLPHHKIKKITVKEMQE
jgi:hypothetical protein